MCSKEDWVDKNNSINKKAVLNRRIIKKLYSTKIDSSKSVYLMKSYYGDKHEWI